MPVTALSLVVLKSADPAGLSRFYSALGLRFGEERHGNGPPHQACEAGGAVFEIYPLGAGEEPTRGVRIGFAVDDVDAAVGAARDAGGGVVSLPRPSPWGRRAVVSDPEGNRVELSASVRALAPA